MIASTSSRCTKPPSVYELTMPNSHMISRITAIVISILVSSWNFWLYD